MKWPRLPFHDWRNKARERVREQFPTPTDFDALSLSHSPLWNATAFFVWDYPFTRGGKLLILAFFFSALPGGITEDVPLFVVPITLISLVLASSAIGSVYRWFKVVVERKFPERVVAGQEVRGQGIVTNRSGWPLYDVAVGCFSPPAGLETIRDDTFIPVLASGETIAVPIRMRAVQRGVYQLPPFRAYTTFPFNLGRNEMGTCRGGTLVVLPRFTALKSLNLDRGARYQPGGSLLTPQVGESPEYIGNRDYVPGDPLRRIDFRSWARLARPVVREYQEEYYCRIALVLDTFLPKRPRKEARRQLEAAVSLTAAVADAASRGEAMIDVFAAGADVHLFRTGRHGSSAHTDSLLEILAGVRPTRAADFGRLAGALSDELRSISTVVFVLLHWDDNRRDLVRRAVEAGCYVKVVLVSGRVKPASAIPEVHDFVSLSVNEVEAGITAL